MANEIETLKREIETLKAEREALERKLRQATAHLSKWCVRVYELEAYTNDGVL